MENHQKEALGSEGRGTFGLGESKCHQSQVGIQGNANQKEQFARMDRIETEGENDPGDESKVTPSQST